MDEQGSSAHTSQSPEYSPVSSPTSDYDGCMEFSPGRTSSIDDAEGAVPWVLQPTLEEIERELEDLLDNFNKMIDNRVLDVSPEFLLWYQECCLRLFDLAPLLFSPDNRVLYFECLDRSVEAAGYLVRMQGTRLAALHGSYRY